MDGEDNRSRLRSFVFGGLLGAAGAFAAVRRSRPRRRPLPPAGLAAFEDAPCFREQEERERRAKGEGPLAARGAGPTQKR